MIRFRFPMVRLLLAALLLIPASGSARTCRILFLGAPANAPQKMRLFDGVKSQEVELPQMNLSPVYRLAGGDITVRLVPLDVEDPAKVLGQAPGARLAANLRDVFLIVTPDPSNPVTPVKIEVIDGDASKFRSGQMYWINRTPYRVGGRLGTRKLDLKPDSRQVVDSPASGGEDYVVSLKYLKPDDERMFPLTETKWRHDPRSRSLQFVVSETGSSVPRILGFDDTRLEAGGE